jgi:hypothetical protein
MFRSRTTRPAHRGLRVGHSCLVRWDDEAHHLGYVVRGTRWHTKVKIRTRARRLGDRLRPWDRPAEPGIHASGFAGPPVKDMTVGVSWRRVSRMVAGCIGGVLPGCQALLHISIARNRHHQLSVGARPAMAGGPISHAVKVSRSPASLTSACSEQASEAHSRLPAHAVRQPRGRHLAAPADGGRDAVVVRLARFCWSWVGTLGRAGSDSTNLRPASRPACFTLAGLQESPSASGPASQGLPNPPSRRSARAPPCRRGTRAVAPRTARDRCCS